MSASTLKITISRESLAERLRVLHDDLNEAGRLNDAMLIDFAIQAISPAIAPTNKSNLIEEIQQAVSEAFGIRYDLMLSKLRSKGVVNARHIAIGLAHLLTAESMPELAKAFNKSDHTTILHAIRKTQTLMDEISARVPRGSDLSEFVTCALSLTERDSQPKLRQVA